METVLEQAGAEDSEEAAANAWEELDRRSGLCGVSYPLELSVSRVDRRLELEDCLPYAFQLATSCWSHYGLLGVDGVTSVRGVYPARIFEQLAAVAIARYIHGAAIRFAAPRTAPIPANYATAVGFVGNHIGESVDRLPSFDAAPQDEHLDVVGWVPFDDHRSGRLVVLGQCAIGRKWHQKLTELSAEAWARYIKFPFRPHRAFAIPYFVPASDEEADPWEYSVINGGMMFDRARIASCLGRPDRMADSYHDPAALQDQMREATLGIVEILPVE